MRFGGIILATVALLGACSSDPAPKEPDRTPPTSAATPARPLPTMPAQASEDTPEGAAAFVKHYVDVVNHAANTGKAETMRALSDECAPCDSFATSFAEEPEDGERFGGKLWSPSRIVVGPGRNPLKVDADVSVQEGTEQVPYTFTFELTSHAPFKVRDITMPEPS